MSKARKSQKAAKNQFSKLAITALLQPAKTYPPVGYVRVSDQSQSMEAQEAILKEAGCVKIFKEKISAVSAKRPQFNLFIKYLEPCDVAMFTELTRLGRDALEVQTTLRYFGQNNIEWKSLSQPHLHTRDAAGAFMTNMAIAQGQFERDTTSERTKRALRIKISQGMYIGAPRKVKVSDIPKMKAMRKRGIPAHIIGKKFKCSASAVYLNTK